MNQNLEKKYGLITAICLVVGAVIGSGIFFLNETVFAATGGRLYLAVIAWLIGGAIMFCMMYVWGQLARNKEGMNGLMDFSDQLVGRTYSYFLTWFLGTILYPSFVAVLAWVTARFTATLLGWSQPNTSGPVWMLAGVYLIGIYTMNVISPKLAGHFQVSTTFIKVIPLLLMGFVGIIAGLMNGTTAENLTYITTAQISGNPLYVAVLATVFAYAGAEEVLMMNSEIKNSKKNLPRAIIIGSIIIIAIYVIYTIGVFGSTYATTLSSPGGIRLGFENLFGPTFGSILIVFIIISCLGAMNSAMMAGSRAFYSIALRNMGPRPDFVRTVDAKTDMPPTSAAISLIFCGTMMFIVFANAQDVGYHARWFGDVSVGVTSLTPITLMSFYIPIFISVMLKEKTWNPFNRFVMPALSIAGAGLLIYMVFDTNFLGAMYYLAGFAVIMAVGGIFLVWNKVAQRNSQFETTEDYSEFVKEIN
ncbi:MAG: APC family permease [Streptococcaceae bacterium]|jgi:APA family basic amino acid/polyamine antiporter|nr:APC family permease [Streptococcaceae bacterium]